eukprot:CAMPEP_0170417688 /NCGR_PEP_ID=MMETSP0117_2-20130122/33846_1 /TAXON_ID=400756 /ORGANISM="Durinskia baltica, Strain CSIRO CS-38" /LENGTH=63 /DNA_ID=CAMNT_0010675883 /DNA_START=124 /DNA_END=312 /DNA_ORIENTATION=+
MAVPRRVGAMAPLAELAMCSPGADSTRGSPRPRAKRSAAPGGKTTRTDIGAYNTRMRPDPAAF